MPVPALTLPARQTRIINASEGLRLEVLTGCLWLTRPGDALDHFLVAGTSIALHENQVLIQTDRHPACTGLLAARYVLTPLATPTPALPAEGRLPSATAPSAWAGAGLLARCRRWLLTPPDRESHSCT